MLVNFFGSDPYLIRQAVQKELTKMSDDALSVTRLDMSRPDDADELERQLKYPSFFQEKRAIIASNVFADAQTAGHVLEILSAHDIGQEPLITVIALGRPEGRISAAAKELAKFFGRHGHSEGFEPLTGTARTKWLSGFCAERGHRLDQSAANELVRRVTDSWALALELEKLCAYAGKEAITAQDVATLVVPPDDGNEFALTDALYAHDKRALVAALWRRLAEGSPEQMVLGTLASGVRSLLIAKAMHAQGSAPAVIAKAAGIHPFVAQKAVRGSSGYAMPSLLKAHERLAGLDRAIKDGRADGTDALMDVVLGL